MVSLYDIGKIWVYMFKDAYFYQIPVRYIQVFTTMLLSFPPFKNEALARNVETLFLSTIVTGRSTTSSASLSLPLA
jgi:hypothetical protein